MQPQYVNEGFCRKKSMAECHEISDDETSSNSSTDEGLECPICWESFNIVENVPYVLWCGHTLCRTCVLGLRLAAMRFSTRRVTIPFFISCPWCNLLTFRFLYKGNLRFPSRNYFLLWMVESRNGDRSRDRQPTRFPTAITNSSSDATTRRLLRLERLQTSFHKSLDFFIKMMAKFPLVILLLVVLFAIPTSASILMLYLIITVVFALPAFSVLYFAYPVLDWLGREIGV